MDIEAINVGERLALWSNGEVTKLDKLFDRDGDETDKPSEALSATTIHPDGTGWCAVDLTKFSSVRMQ